MGGGEGGVVGRRKISDVYDHPKIFTCGPYGHRDYSFTAEEEDDIKQRVVEAVTSNLVKVPFVSRNGK